MSLSYPYDNIENNNILRYYKPYIQLTKKHYISLEEQKHTRSPSLYISGKEHTYLTQIYGKFLT